jgi:hypothetical protein
MPYGLHWSIRVLEVDHVHQEKFRENQVMSAGEGKCTCRRIQRAVVSKIESLLRRMITLSTRVHHPSDKLYVSITSSINQIDWTMVPELLVTHWDLVRVGVAFMHYGVYINVYGYFCD